jgi:pyruvate dehydrogenase E1 component alpha subunit
VEARTYRLLGHTFGADQSYQPAEELAAARAAEPVQAFRDRLIGRGVLDQEAVAAIQKEIDQEVDDALEFARSSSPPAVDELLVDVFSDKLEVPA